MAPPSSGPHAIINRKSKTALTASDGPEPNAITGNQYDGTQEQKWDLIDLGGQTYEIRKIGSGGFVGVLGGPNPGSEIFVLPENTQWKITPAYEFGPEHYRIAEPGNPGLVVTLANDGSAAPGTPVKLEPFFEYKESQVWEFRSLGA